MKVFIGLTEIAGYYTNLKKGFDTLGVECVFVDSSGHPFKYSRETAPNIIVRLVEDLGNRSQTAQVHLTRVMWNSLQLALMLPLFIWAILHYDVFIFGFNSSFLFFRDLPILKLLNKKIIYVFHGSDSRPPYLDGSVMAADRGLTTERCIRLTRKKKRVVKRIERYADIIISHPLSSHLHEKRFASFILVGLPYDLSSIHSPRRQTPAKQPVRILHSPSHPEAKGTPAIRKAIELLRSNGHLIEFIEIIDKPNAVVLSELARSDFVVDQLYSDTPMAGFATEAAFFQKPSIVGSYGETEFNAIFPAGTRPPSHCCHPDQINQAIEKLIADEEYRLQLGMLAGHYVEENWTPMKVADRYLRLIEGGISPDWLYDPRTIHYLHGFGLSEEQAKKLVRAVIETGGTEALQVSDKPELERLFIEFAYSKTA